MKINGLILTLILFFGACTSNTNQGNVQTNEITWNANKYAQLFEIGISKTDTFIRLYTFNQVQANVPQNKTLIGSFFWGKTKQSGNFSASPGSTEKYYTKISKRHRYILLSTVFTRFFAELNQKHNIVGVDKAKYLCKDIFPQKNKIPSVQPTGEINAEAALNLSPDIVVAYFISNKEKSNLERLNTKKTQVLFCQSHLENHPLGRAEWITLFGFLTGSEKAYFFSDIEFEYMRLKKDLSETTQVNVMINLPYSGTWDVPRKNAYLAILLKDAKTNPVWLENNNYKGVGSAQIGLELGYQLLSKASFWINPGMCESIACIKNTDPRIAKCLPVINNKVFQCNLTQEPDGANAYWDLGAVHPEYVLSDFAKMFHSEKPDFAAKNYYFYQQLK